MLAWIKNKPVLIIGAGTAVNGKYYIIEFLNKPGKFRVGEKKLSWR